MQNFASTGTFQSWTSFTALGGFSSTPGQDLAPSPTAARPKVPPPSPAVPTLREAGNALIEQSEPYRKPKTIECQRGYLARLLEHFGDMPLADFQAEHLRGYQVKRANVAGASAINHELSFLSRLLKDAELWAPIKKQYHLGVC